MISIKKYLDGQEEREQTTETPVIKPPIRDKQFRPSTPLQAWIEAYRAALDSMSHAGSDACPALGSELTDALATIRDTLHTKTPTDRIVSSDRNVRTYLRGWGQKTAQHYNQKAAEVKEVLLTVARTAESVSQRDQRCAQQMDAVRTQLERIANLEDISQMRRSIESSASELKRSIDQMAAEGKTMIEGLQARVSTFQAKLEEAEKVASIDALTRVRTRLWLEGQLQLRIEAASQFCVALLDIDGFKIVNDRHGHVVGDELLRQFAGELKSACRSTDPVGRWGGDEFLILLDGSLDKAEAQMERVREWVCGSYTISGKEGPLKLQVGASIGIAEFHRAESIKDLLGRADAAMYKKKAVARRERKAQMCAS